MFSAPSRPRTSLENPSARVEITFGADGNPSGNATAIARLQRSAVFGAPTKSNASATKQAVSAL